MKILHITPWYPTPQNSKKAVWIQNHIDALQPFITGHYILHLEVQPSHHCRFHKNDLNKGLQRVLEIPIHSWFMIEVLSTALLIYYLMKLKPRKYDILNFHIAYPNLTYWHWIKKWIAAPVVITEHWSAYHFNFSTPQSKDLYRVKRIFRQNIPLISVSESLKDDIKTFSNAVFPSYVLPNVVDTAIFNFKESKDRKELTFFMLSQWKWPKDPFTIIKAFSLCAKKTPAQLKIGGYGPQLDKMKRLAHELNLDDRIVFLGKLDADQIAMELNSADAFLHCSAYETFAVVCAEALCCGCPVVASAVGGLREFIDETNGILLADNSADIWAGALDDITKKQVCRKDISLKSTLKFDKKVIGQKYLKIIKDIRTAKEIEDVNKQVPVSAGRQP